MGLSNDTPGGFPPGLDGPTGEEWDGDGDGDGWMWMRWLLVCLVSSQRHAHDADRAARMRYET